MRRVALILPIFLFSCGSGGHDMVNDPRSGVSTVVNREMPEIVTDDDTLHELVYQFYADAEWLNTPTLTDFKTITIVESAPDLVDGVVGVCKTYGVGKAETYREVLLLKSFWDSVSYEAKRTLVFHESSHCALDLGHTAPDSMQIMQPTVLPDEYAIAHWIELVEFLFASAKH